MVTLGIFSAFTPQNVLYLLGGLGITVGVSVISVILSLIFGSIVGIIQFERLPYFSKFVGTINNIIRNLPLLLIIFFCLFCATKNWHSLTNILGHSYCNEYI